jgi:hypothetical protein
VREHDNRHARNEHKYRRHGYAAVIAVIEDHDGLFLSRLATFSLMLRDKDPQLRSTLLLE